MAYIAYMSIKTLAGKHAAIQRQLTTMYSRWQCRSSKAVKLLSEVRGSELRGRELTLEGVKEFAAMRFLILLIVLHHRFEVSFLRSCRSRSPAKHSLRIIIVTSCQVMEQFSHCWRRGWQWHWQKVKASKQLRLRYNVNNNKLA